MVAGYESRKMNYTKTDANPNSVGKTEAKLQFEKNLHILIKFLKNKLVFSNL